MCSVARAARGWGGGGWSVRLVNVSCLFTCVVAHRHMPRQITEQRAAAQSCQLEPNPKIFPELHHKLSASGTCRRCRRTPCPSPPPGQPLQSHHGQVTRRRVSVLWFRGWGRTFRALVLSISMFWTTADRVYGLWHRVYGV